MTAPFFLATSLAPGRDVALQRAAIKSWRDAGFAVLSVNAATEVPALVRDHPDVTFITAASTGEKIAGKPVPFVHDLMHALRAAAEARGVPLADCLVGIVNDDIHFRLTAGDTAELVQAAQGSVVLGARIDVPTAYKLGAFTPAGNETYAVGYDFFLMSGDVLADFANAPFCLGMPFWDYWLPLVALLKGRPLKALRSPVALHIAHDTRWDNAIYVFFHALINSVMDVSRASRERDTSADARQFDLLYDAMSHIYADVFARGTTPRDDGALDPGGIAALAAFYDRFQEVAVHHIKSRATPLVLGAHTA